MNFLQKEAAEIAAENEEDIMSFFKRSYKYIQGVRYRVSKYLNGWYSVCSLTLDGYLYAHEMLFHFDAEGCDLIVESPTSSFTNSLHLMPDNRESLETQYGLNVVVFEVTSCGEEVPEENILDVLKSRYQDQSLFILRRAKRNKNSILIGRKNEGDGESPYAEFCIAKVKNGKLHHVILNPEYSMMDNEGF